MGTGSVCPAGIAVGVGSADGTGDSGGGSVGVAGVGVDVGSAGGSFEGVGTTVGVDLTKDPVGLVVESVGSDDLIQAGPVRKAATMVKRTKDRPNLPALRRNPRNVSPNPPCARTSRKRIPDRIIMAGGYCPRSLLRS